jgi:hypothetical protein
MILYQSHSVNKMRDYILLEQDISIFLKINLKGYYNKEVLPH